MNLGHTVLADRWINAYGAANVLVREIMADKAEISIYADEVRPAFIAAGQAEAFDTYVTTTLERFANPFLNHRIADIAQNHAQKVKRRVEAMLQFAQAKGDHTPKPVLAEVVSRQKQAAI